MKHLRADVIAEVVSAGDRRQPPRLVMELDQTVPAVRLLQLVAALLADPAVTDIRPVSLER